jgi:lysyl-tRNA synthetase, class II
VTDLRAAPATRPVVLAQHEGDHLSKWHLRDDRWPDWLATLTLLSALFVLVVSAVPRWREYFLTDDDLVTTLLVPIVPNIVYAALLGGIGIGLRRRLRAAWWVFVAVLVVVPIGLRIGLIRDGDRVALALVGILIGVALLVVAVLAYRQFTARPALATALSALVVFVGGLLVTLVVGNWLVSQFGGAASGQGIGEITHGIVSDLGVVTTHAGVTAPGWVRALVFLMGAASIVGAAWVLFHAPSRTRVLNARDEAWVRALLREYGDEDSLGYFATRRDKAVTWTMGDSGVPRAGVSYRVVNGVSLASGNPIGDVAHWGTAIEAWREEARANGWSLAVMGAGESGARAYTAAGLVAFEIGDEAIVDLAGFSLNGPGLKPVRQAVHRLRKRGFTTRVVHHDGLGADDFARLATAASEWRGDGGDERGFSMALGRLGDPLDGECVLVEALDGDGVLHGFLSFVPWGRAGLSLDLMRRDPTSGNGIVELMVVALAEAAGRMHVRRASLNFAMFREAFARGEEVGAGPIARAGRQILLLASRNWQLESLYRSNAKYMPEWQPRFVCFEYASDLPRVGIAAGNAEGFLNSPSIGAFLHRGHAAEENELSHAADSYAAQVLAELPPEPDELALALSQTRQPQQVRVRRAKLEALQKQNIDCYPVGYPRTSTMAQVRSAAGPLPADTRTGAKVAVAGRMMGKRDLGGLCFFTLRDGTGDIQVIAGRDVLGADAQRRLRSFDLGDHIGASGEVVTSRRGELSVLAESFDLTSKSLRPLPDKRRGLTDPEARVRLRYVDLIMRPAARDIAYMRAAIVRSLRDSLHARGFVEVETPILQLVHGGANARPFLTHINAYDLDLSLRIATELHLKRLVVGGMEQVFELGRQFRNEGADSSHNPEFTSLEVYQTYSDYVGMRLLTQELIQEAATTVYGSPIARRVQPNGKREEVDLSGDWPAVPICSAVSTALGEEVTPDTPGEELVRHGQRIGLELDPDAGWGTNLEEIYSELCEHHTSTPVFYTDFPRDTSPLTRAHRDDPRLVEKWDLVMWSSEQATAYSELTDPIDQRMRLVEQSLLAAAGDAEAMEVDEDFLKALEYAMPPTGGMGMGVDRLVMNLTGLGIRDTILFPLVRPR